MHAIPQNGAGCQGLRRSALPLPERLNTVAELPLRESEKCQCVLVSRANLGSLLSLQASECLQNPLSRAVIALLAMKYGRDIRVREAALLGKLLSRNASHVHSLHYFTSPLTRQELTSSSNIFTWCS